MIQKVKLYYKEIWSYK